MNRLKKLQGRWRLWWGFCPACNSDAPEIDNCEVCQQGAKYPFNPEVKLWPVSDKTKAEWWQRFVNPPAPENCNCFVSTSDEPRWKTILRKILRAYWQHEDLPNPCDVILKPGFYRRGKEPQVYREPGEGLTQVVPPVKAADAIISRTEVTIGWLDFLRIALGCKLQVNLAIYCENLPGEAQTRAKVFTTLK